jgi:SAM-dependent methyltransferase
MQRLPDEILAYYERGDEDQRLRAGVERLEFWRTQDVLRRLLPSAARVLDLGGGTGVHAEWLAAGGHDVELIDPVPLHVDRAAQLPGVTARVGNALDVDVADESFDVVLLLGPLYHLTEPADRLRALAEARRVARTGGLVVVATISRFAPLHDTLRLGRYFDADVRDRVEISMATGAHRPRNSDGLFTTAYFHEPGEIVDELGAAGLAVTGQFGVEGAAWLISDMDSWLDDPDRRAAVLRALRLTESAPSLLGVSAHVLSAARVP